MGTDLLHADLTYAIRGVLFDVGKHLGPGLPEETIQKAVSIGLARRRIPHAVEEQFHVFYRGVEVGRYYCDLVVGGQVIVELKVAPTLTGLHRAQILSYLRVTGADVGLLANFGTAKVDVERYARFYAQRQPDFAWHPQVPDDPSLLYAELVGELYAALNRVHYELGPGFMHHVYRRAAQVELDERGIGFEMMREMPVYYQGEYVGRRECRLLIVDDKVIMAVFAVRDMGAAYDTRMRRYLDCLRLKLGLLANCHDERLEIRPVRVA